MKQSKVLSMLGLAARGRNVVSGELQTLNAVKDGSAILVIVAEDASENTRKLFGDKCSFYGVMLRTYGTRESLGRAIGKGERSSLALIDEGLAQSVIRHLESEADGWNGGI